METKYPTLKRPKRKLCYLTNSNSPSIKWTRTLTPTLGAIDKIFDDLDSSSIDDVDIVPPSPLRQTSDNETNQSEKEVSTVPQEGQILEKPPGSHMGPKGDILHPATRSPSPNLDIDLNFQFKMHGPVKTSSPIEENMAVERVAELDEEKDRVVSPILFACEDDEEEEAEAEHLYSQKPQREEHITKESDDFGLESPPNRVALSKPKMSCHKKELEGLGKEGHPVKGNSSSKTQTDVSEGKPERQEKTEASVSNVRQDPKLAAPNKKSESVHNQPSVEVSTCVRKNMTTFIQKLKEAGLSKPACSRKSLSPVKVSTPPPEPEEDFLILEEETPLWISIPTKSATGEKQRPSRTSSTDKDSSKDKGTEESPPERTQEQQESNQANRKVGHQAVSQEIKKMKVKEKKNESAKQRTDTTESTSPEDLPVVELLEQEKPNKKKQWLKKLPPKESDKAEEQPEDTAEREREGGEPTPKRLNNQPPVEVSTRVRKDMSAFLLKLREAGLSKPACSRKSLSPVKVSTPPPEPEEDFLILEDETPLWISIPTKSATSKKQRPNRTSSTDKDSSKDKGTQGQQESNQKNRKVGHQTVSQEMKKMKVKEKKNESAKQRTDTTESTSPEDQQEKPNKKKQRLKKLPPKESDKAEEQPEDTAEREREGGEPTQDKTGRAKSSKGGRKVMQGSDGRKEAVYTETAKEPSKEHEDLEDQDSASERETSKDFSDGEDEQIQTPPVSDGTPPEDDHIIGKRKRKQTRRWWLSSPEETEAADHWPTVKKQSKQNNKEPIAATRSPVKAKKEKALKKRNQTECATSSCQDKNKGRSKIKKKEGDTPGKKRATEERGKEEAEPIEEQEQQGEVEDQNLDEGSSPLDLSHRGHSLSTGEEVFHRVYHHVSTEKQYVTPAPTTPRRPREQLRTAESDKRRRKRPGNWWAVDGPTEEAENISSKPQQEPKPKKERKKESKQSRGSKLGAPKNGNVAVSSKPPEGAAVPPLKGKPLSALKTVKRSLATFEDIFTSAAETSTVESSRGAVQKNTRKVRATDLSVPDKSDKGILNEVNVEVSPPYHDTPQDDKGHSEDISIPFRSGPPSMFELQEYEEHDTMTRPSPSVLSALSASDLCAPPLKPLILQPKDKANLAEWFKCLWSTSIDKGPEVSPEHFDWYFYQGRAIGFMVDLNSGNICSGKILLGSYMKKPLWVDHSATSVFHLLTSSVSVAIDGSESRFNPGQSFMVPCGHAYCIENVSRQPAVLYFTRVLTESLD
ncbi:titin homolog [Labrus mixtus]|uniref:titin homolog n=1 Tax=Labrus mixtus TaxID=508554 RepID=UPI0029BFDAF1|nr:titin homolog [Labrus mixtus]